MYFCPPPVDIDREGDGIGAVAAREIFPGEVLLDLPASEWITPELVSEEFPDWSDLDPLWQLALYVAYHRFVGMLRLTRIS